jgi:uncharacterized membrane protein
MKKNVCGIERGVRAILGIALVMVYVTGIGEGAWGIVATFVGCILIITAASSYCPVNTLLGVNSCKRKITKEELPIGMNQMYQNPQANEGYVSEVPNK